MMKNTFKKVCVFLAAATAFLLTLTAVGCGGTVAKYDSSISEIRDAVYEGAGDNFSVSAVSGLREDPFSADGKAEKKREFTVITVTPREFIPNKLYNYTVSINGNEFTGVMSMHPFGETYSVEIAARTHEAELNVNVKSGSVDETVALKNVVEDDDIDADKALDAAIKALQADLKPIRRGNSFDCEIYVRLIANPINAEGGYFWYVAFMGEKNLAVLLNRKTAEVIAVKN